MPTPTQVAAQELFAALLKLLGAVQAEAPQPPAPEQRTYRPRKRRGL